MSKSYRPDELRVVLTLPDGTQQVCEGYLPPQREFPDKPNYIAYHGTWKIEFYRELDPQNNS